MLFFSIVIKQRNHMTILHANNTGRFFCVSRSKHILGTSYTFRVLSNSDWMINLIKKSFSLGNSNLCHVSIDELCDAKINMIDIFQISGRKHDCDSPDGLCSDKCPFRNGTFPFWRIRNADEVPFLWTIKTLQMFDNPNSRYPLTKDPARGYASTFFGPGMIDTTYYKLFYDSEGQN